MTTSEIRRGRKPTLVSIYGSLNPQDVQRLNQTAMAKGMAPSAIVREAVLLYLDGIETKEIDARESLVEKRLKKMEERLASLLARTAIDAGMIFQILQSHMNPETKAEDLMWVHNLAVKRLKTKLSGQNLLVKDLAIEPGQTDSSQTSESEETDEEANSEEGHD